MFPNPMWPYLRRFDDDQRILGLDEAIATALSGDTYADKVKAIFGSSLIDYRQLREGSGTSALDSSPKAHAAGTISGATWTQGAGFDGGPALLFDGVNDYVDIYSAALNTDFVPATLTTGVLAKVSGAGIWTDGTSRVLRMLAVGTALDRIVLRRSTTNTNLLATVVSGGVLKVVEFSTASPAGWFSLIATISGGVLSLYYNGVLQGTPQSGLGVWSGALNSANCTIGSIDTSGTNPFSGNIREAFLASRAATATEVAQLAVF